MHLLVQEHQHIRFYNTRKISVIRDHDQAGFSLTDNNITYYSVVDDNTDFTKVTEYNNVTDIAIGVEDMEISFLSELPIMVDEETQTSEKKQIVMMITNY